MPAKQEEWFHDSGAYTQRQETPLVNYEQAAKPQKSKIGIKIGN